MAACTASLGGKPHVKAKLPPLHRNLPGELAVRLASLAATSVRDDKLILFVTPINALIARVYSCSLSLAVHASRTLERGFSFPNFLPVTVHPTVLHT